MWSRLNFYGDYTSDAAFCAGRLLSVNTIEIVLSIVINFYYIFVIQADCLPKEHTVKLFIVTCHSFQ